MKSKLTYAFTALVTIILFTCSPEDSNSISAENTKEFVFNGVTYDIVSAIVTDQNTNNNEPSDISISLFNKTSAEITGNADLSAISYVYFAINDATLQNTTYTQIEDYDISINGSVVDSDFNPGTVLLSDNDSDADVFAQSGSLTVTNFTAFNIKFTFTFTRNDGQVVSGSYDGNYFAPNGID